MHILKSLYPYQKPVQGSGRCTPYQALLKPQLLRQKQASLITESPPHASLKLAHPFPPQLIRHQFRNGSSTVPEEKQPLFAPMMHGKSYNMQRSTALKTGRETTLFWYQNMHLPNRNDSANLEHRPRHINGCRVYNTRVHSGFPGRTVH